MKAYNESVMSMESLSLFTDYAKKEGEERGIQIGEKRGIKIGEKRGLKIGEKRGIQIGKVEGIKIGEEKGIEIATLKFVLNAAGRGIPAEEIAGITDLTVEQVHTILRKREQQI
jgi:hypothetical protein